MAATEGRADRQAGVCLSTLGPGALELHHGGGLCASGRAMPMLIREPGRRGIRHSPGRRSSRSSISSAAMRPLTKMTRADSSARHRYPTLVRDAFRIAVEERPGPVHLELPEDIAAEGGRRSALIPAASDRPAPIRRRRRVERVRQDEFWPRRDPLIMIGAGGRPAASGRSRSPISCGACAVAVLQHPRWARAAVTRRVQSLSRHRGAPPSAIISPSSDRSSPTSSSPSP